MLHPIAVKSLTVDLGHTVRERPVDAYPIIFGSGGQGRKAEENAVGIHVDRVHAVKLGSVDAEKGFADSFLR